MVLDGSQGKDSPRGDCKAVVSDPGPGELLGLLVLFSPENKHPFVKP